MSKKNINEWMALCLSGTFALTIANIHHPLHYVFGILLFMLVVVHLCLHAKWIGAWFSGRISRQIVHRKMNVWLFCILTVCGISGILNLLREIGLSPWSRHQTFHIHVLHAVAGFASIIMMVTHLIMHRKWLVAVIRRNLSQTKRQGSACPEN
jgi:hypothetical protein